MALKDLNGLLVFKEQSYMFGIQARDFDAYIPLNKLAISPLPDSQSVWKFEGNSNGRTGYFVHPAMLFGFRNIRFDQSGILFVRKLSAKTSVGLVLNHYQMSITSKKYGPKPLAPHLIKTFPPELPQSAFEYVQRYKRQDRKSTRLNSSHYS